ncbi:MAG: T9SS type A sorting domain-containing protein [Candidatus Kapaibacterium sp.]
MTVNLHYLSVVLSLLLLSIPASAQSPTIISGVINTYAKVTAVDYCGKTLTVTSTAGFSIGDRALLIQMQGATIDTTNTDQFGTITAIGEAGNCEYVTIEAVAPTTLRLKTMLVQNYNPQGAVQLVRVPKYVTAWVQGAPLTAQAWDGSTGGVLAFEASGAVDILGTIDVSGKGFRGGAPNTGTITEYHQTDYTTKLADNKGGAKGEGIAKTDTLHTASRGANANAGGGGNAHNAGGGGGSNYGAGGIGGNEYQQGTSLTVGGVGGKELRYSGTYPKIFMGGGGGGGHQNNTVGTPGTAGGGIVIIKSGVLVGRGNSILAGGADQKNSARNDGAGGGGGGGSVYLDVERITSSVTVDVHGGKGGAVSAEPHGPGGGGGGGSISVRLPATLDSILPLYGGGAAGVMTSSNTTWGAEAGKPGGTQTGIAIPEGTESPLQVLSSKDTTICAEGGVAIIGRSATGGRKPYKYAWSPALGLDNPTVETPRATPSVSTFYTVTVTDSTGCVAQAQMWVQVYPKQVISAGKDTGICLGSSVQLQATGKGRFIWSPGTGLSDTTVAKPIASPLQTTVYTLTVIDSNGCTSRDSVTVQVYDLPTITIGPDDSVCDGNALFIYNIEAKNGTPPYEYRWSPSTGVSDVTTPAPVFSPVTTTRYTLTVMDAHGCMAADSFTITVNPLPIADAGTDRAICKGDTTRLNGTTSTKVSWTPALGLSSTTIPDPLAFPAQSTTYYLTLENEFGCTATDSVRVTVHALPPAPSLTLSTDTISSSSAVPVREYKWYRDGVIVAGTTSSILVATESGDYTLTIIDSNGCAATSAPLDVILGRATLSIDDICAYPGELVEIPIRLVNAERITQSQTAQFDLTLSFNASLLAPIDAGLMENSVKNGVRSIRVRVPFVVDSFPILTRLRFYAGLGDDTVTDLRLTNYTSIGGRVFLSDSVGHFCIKGVCTDGSVRLYRSGELSAITSIIPQPAGDKITIDYISGEAGISTLSLVNVLGQTVATLVRGYQPAGIQRVEAELTNYNSGVYFVVLQTPTERVVRMLEIHK